MHNIRIYLLDSDSKLGTILGILDTYYNMTVTGIINSKYANFETKVRDGEQQYYNNIYIYTAHAWSVIISIRSLLT